MIKEELIRRSPIRVFERSIQGGLKPGEIGIVASQRGVGKTSVLVQIALDKLLQGKKAIHVSFAQNRRQNVFAWYEDIFEEFVGSKDLQDKDEVKTEIAKNRVLMNFNQDGMTLDMIAKSLRAMIADGGFAAEALVVDGFDFARADREYVSKLKGFALDMGLSVWCNCTVNGDEPRYDGANVPTVVKDIVDLIDVVIVLEPKGDHVELSVSKARDAASAQSPAARLDPRTLLLLET